MKMSPGRPVRKLIFRVLAAFLLSACAQKIAAIRFIFEYWINNANIGKFRHLVIKATELL
jgi:hypothetical protein